jgi:hypothetical protein
MSCKAWSSRHVEHESPRCASAARAGRRGRALDPGPAWKLLASQYATHFATTAALDCRARIDDPAAIERIVVNAPVMPCIDRPQPRSGLDGKSSYQSDDGPDRARRPDFRRREAVRLPGLHTAV